MAKIMCIDDSSTIRMLVKKTLEPVGYDMIEAENGQEALEKSKGQAIALFIVDVNMPVMDGFECVKALRNDSNYKSTPIIFLTTESSTQKKQIGEEIGATGWIVKPFEPESLLKVIAVLLG